MLHRKYKRYADDFYKKKGHPKKRDGLECKLPFNYGAAAGLTIIL